MATVDDVLDFQTKYSILKPPTEPVVAEVTVAAAATTPLTMQFALRNNTSSSRVYAYVTGLDVSSDSRVVLLQADGHSTYYPVDPGADLQPLQADCAIALGAPGTTRTITIPRVVGGRVWFVQDATLTFLLNRASGGKAALVEPSVMNPSDKNYELLWSFCEFTFNEVELFANISYVDFVSHPISLRLEPASGSGGKVQEVKGIPSDGLASVAAKLVEQHRRDGAGWDRLVVRSATSGKVLRAVSPNTGIHLFGLFDGYYQSYVDQVWARYSSANLTVNTQFTWGVATGRVASSTGLLTFGNIGGFARPSAKDIFSSDSGAFAPQPGANSEELKNIAARLAAAFNRATLLINSNQPDGETVGTYYQNAICNHYSRILHEVNIDNRGYAFPYDDVTPTGGGDQAGTVASGTPGLFTIVLGGGSNTTVSSVRVREMARPGRQLPGAGGFVRSQRVRRSMMFLGEAGDGLGEEVANGTVGTMGARDAQAGLPRTPASMSDSKSDNYRRNDDLHQLQNVHPTDLERGTGEKLDMAGLGADMASHGAAGATLLSMFPPSLRARVEALLLQRQAEAEGAEYGAIDGSATATSPGIGRPGRLDRIVNPAVDVLVRIIAAVVTMPLRAFASRMAMLLLCFVSYFVWSPLVHALERQRDLSGTVVTPGPTDTL